MMGAFDDLAEAEEGTESEADDEPAPEPADAETEPETEDSGGLDSPAFPYGDVKQGPIYPREESWNDLEDALALEVTPTLHKQGVRNAEKREIHDAMVQLAVENPVKLADIVLEAREEDE